MNRKALVLLSLLILAALLCFALIACDGGDSPSVEVPDDKLLLIDSLKARFKIVTTQELTAAELSEVEGFVTQLRELGIEVADPLSDSDSDISDLEIIFGTGVRQRGNFKLDKKALGKDGYTVKVMSEERGSEEMGDLKTVYKIVVAGATEEKFKAAVSQLLTQGFIIDKYTSSREVEVVMIDKSFDKSRKPTYHINTVTVGDVPLSKFVFSYKSSAVTDIIVNYLQSAFFEYTGVYIKKQSELASGENAEYTFNVRLTDSNSGPGFSVVTSGKTITMTCTNQLRFKAACEKYINNTLVSVTSGKVDLGKKYEWDIGYRYSEFGAVGDGIADDFLAMLATHERANFDGLKVLADEKATYYIGPDSYGKSITVNTDVDFANATIIIDDRKVNPFNPDERSKNIFDIRPDIKRSFYFEETQFLAAGLVKSLDSNGNPVYKKANGAPVFTQGQSKIPFTFDGKVMIKIVNSLEDVYIRYGANSGASKKMEMLLVDKDGTVDPTTPILWDYSGISELQVLPIDDTTITMENGTFITYANQLKYDNIPEGFLSGDQYYYFARGISVTRSNTVVRNIKHKIEKETEYKDGDPMNGGYPYSGWLGASGCNNILFESCILSGHRQYKEDRDINGDGIPDEDRGTNMGTYDTGAYACINITWRNCSQYNSISNSVYWGIMGSNFVRNFTYDKCNLSRFDAHQGVCNATIIDSTIGLAINCIGSGKLTIKNTTKLTGTDFVSLRADYGATWEGDAEIINCTHQAYTDHELGETYSEAGIFGFRYTPDWNFGYTCYMPQNIKIENFKYNSGVKNMYLFYTNNPTGFNSSAFTNILNPYQPPKSITLLNQTQIIKASNAAGVFTELVTLGKLAVNDTASKLII